ncbi:MAG: putative dsRNA-binding protein, partial [Verrucomicrobiota bacterium]
EMSRGEELSGGRHRPSILADAFESLLGAVFLDGGYEAARAVILRQFDDAFRGIDSASRPPGVDNPKGELQELLQASSNEAPEYRLVTATGPDHNRLFECSVHHGGVELGRGTGKSKKVAESQAAQAALDNLRARKA